MLTALDFVDCRAGWPAWDPRAIGRRGRSKEFSSGRWRSSLPQTQLVRLPEIIEVVEPPDELGAEQIDGPRWGAGPSGRRHEHLPREQRCRGGRQWAWQANPGTRAEATIMPTLVGRSKPG
jgi:hypothetical protein